MPIQTSYLAANPFITMAVNYDNELWNRKRLREQGDDGSFGGFSEHRNKRLNALPLRTAPQEMRWSDLSTITPVDSEGGDASSCCHQTQFQHQQSDLQMMVDTPAPYGTNGPPSCAPPALQLGDTARIPTPIHCTFAAQLHSNNQTGFPAPQDPSVPRSLQAAPEWSMVQNRRLPSPISESGGEDGPASPGMALHPNIHAVPSEDGADASMSDADADGDFDVGTPPPTSAPTTPSPKTKFGHSRSKHTINSWTAAQPGMKKAFSIGYRADCEKCRQKIPGHFNHIIVT